MSQIHVGVIVGSLRKASFNRRLAKAVISLAPSDLKFSFIEIGHLPLYNEEQDANQPESSLEFKSALASVDALLFVTPEYNRSVPGVLKNALDVGSRPWGQNSFAGKPGAVIGASVGAMGSALAQQHLRNILSYLEVPLLTQPEVYLHFTEDLIDAQGNVQNERTRQFLQKFVDQYVQWLRKF